jgi:hypothetical protein
MYDQELRTPTLCPGLISRAKISPTILTGVMAMQQVGLGPYCSGEPFTLAHTWKYRGNIYHKGTDDRHGRCIE